MNTTHAAHALTVLRLPPSGPSPSMEQRAAAEVPWHACRSDEPTLPPLYRSEGFAEDLDDGYAVS